MLNRLKRDDLPSPYPLPDNEPERLAELRKMAILGLPAEQEFHQLASLAAAMLGTPMAFLSFIDEETQWLKVRVGLELTETPREHAFCNHTILGQDVLVVEDATKDLRFHHNPFVVNDPKIRFYAGVPVASDNGFNVGSLCVIDSMPKRITVEQQAALKSLGSLASSLLARRRAGLRASELAEELEQSRTLLQVKSEQLHQTTQLLAKASEVAKLGAWELDASSKRLLWSDFMYDLHELEHGVPVGLEDLLRFYPEQQRRAKSLLRRYLTRNEPFTFEGEMRTAKGNRRWVRVNAEIEVKDGHIRHFGTKQDITEERAALEALRRVSDTDALTSLANRRSLLRHLGTILRRSQPLALFLMDLDGFKDINDVHGHAAGDHCLKMMARRLQAVAQDGQFLARLGGDEFALAASAPHEAEKASEFADHILAAIARPVRWNGTNLQFSASIGIALSRPSQTLSSSELLAQADLALYHSKSLGRNCSSVFYPALKCSSERKAAVISSVREALARGELELFYQARVPLADGKKKGFEALLRWRNQGVLQSPDSFRAALDDPQLSILIGNFVLEEALDQAARWRDQNLDFGLISINVGAGQFRQPTLGLKIIKAVVERGLRPDMVEIEITEDVLLSRSGDTVLDVCRGLRDFGIGIAFDDFGTGFASLTHLLDFPISTLKIDRSFVKRLGSHAGTKSVVAAMCAVGHDLKMDVVAEGVETEQQAELLRTLGCDFAQGYLFHRPAPAQDCAVLLQSSNALGEAGSPRVETH